MKRYLTASLLYTLLMSSSAQATIEESINHWYQEKFQDLPNQDKKCMTEAIYYGIVEHEAKLKERSGDNFATERYPELPQSLSTQGIITHIENRLRELKRDLDNNNPMLLSAMETFKEYIHRVGRAYIVTSKARGHSDTSTEINTITFLKNTAIRFYARVYPDVPDKTITLFRTPQNLTLPDPTNLENRS